jgi:hypothetical protein
MIELLNPSRGRHGRADRRGYRMASWELIPELFSLCLLRRRGLAPGGDLFAAPFAGQRRERA